MSCAVARTLRARLQGGALSLRGCVICSSSGSGVGVDGGALEMEECDVQDCQLHGLAVFGSLEGGGAGGRGEAGGCRSACAVGLTLWR